MPRSTGLAPRRGYPVDALAVLVGDVLPGYRGRVAETRTGAARLLATRLDAQDVVKIIAFGQTANAAGGYVIQAASVAQGAAIGTASAYANIGIISVAGQNTAEVSISGRQVQEAVRAAGNLTGDVRVTAVRAIAGKGTLTISNVALTSNVATITTSANHGLVVGEVVTVGCSDPRVNGTFAVASVPTATTFTYASTQSNITSASATGQVTNGVAAPVGTITVQIQPIE